MVESDRVRFEQLLRKAEGYLELDLPAQALRELERLPANVADWPDAACLRGEAFLALDRYSEAIPWFRKAARASGGNLAIYLGLGWCYKRTGRLDLAIKALERALAIEPEAALVHYNLACYWSLSGNKAQCLRYLGMAILKDPQCLNLIGNEPDFDPVRSDPDFQSLTNIVA